MQKTVDYYNTRIKALKAKIKRPNTEKRITILRERERTRRTKKQKGKGCQNPIIQAALINATAFILGQFINFFLISHSNRQGVTYQQNILIVVEPEAKEDKSSYNQNPTGLPRHSSPRLHIIVRLRPEGLRRDSHHSPARANDDWAMEECRRDGTR